MKEFRLIIAGSRDFYDYEALRDETDLFIEQLRDRKDINEDDFIIIVSGGARGADKLGERYARERNYHCEIHPANWSIGKQAGILRNIAMAKISQACIIFKVNDSKGSTHMSQHATKQGLMTKVVSYYV